MKASYGLLVYGALVLTFLLSYYRPGSLLQWSIVYSVLLFHRVFFTLVTFNSSIPIIAAMVVSSTLSSSLNIIIIIIIFFFFSSSLSSHRPSCTCSSWCYFVVVLLRLQTLDQLGSTQLERLVSHLPDLNITSCS